MIIANGGFAALDEKTAARVLSDKELLMAAAQSSTLYIEDLDQVFENDRELLLEILATNTNLYHSLPKSPRRILCRFQRLGRDLRCTTWSS